MEEKEIPNGCLGCMRGSIWIFIVFLAIVGVGILISSVDLSCSEKNNYQESSLEKIKPTEIKIDSVTLKENEVEQRRKEIFAVDGQWYKLAVEKAMDKYPYDLKKQMAYQEKLEKSFRKQLEKKYSLKKSELDSIILEGGEKRWTWN